MSELKKCVAEKAIAGLALAPSNAELARHWLSLWPGDELPLRAAFRPAKLKPYLPNLLLFNVVPDASVTVRLAGTGFRHILGTELTGKDWIALAPESYRATRLGLFSAVARGAVVVAHRRVALNDGADQISEEILLPFAPEADGASPVLVHVDWKPQQFLRIQSVAQVVADPLDWKLVKLTAA
jgi:hypothetical protein